MGSNNIQRLKSKNLVRLGLPKGAIAGFALELLRKNFKGQDADDVLPQLEALIADPTQFTDHPVWGPLAEKLAPEPEGPEGTRYPLRDQPLNYKMYGAEGISESTQWQMDIAMRLPVAAAGALMPDAHKGYGLPVGGVLATHNAVIPYAVGMDIGCRMCLSVLDMPVSDLQHRNGQLAQIVRDNTAFGKEFFSERMDHPVLDRGTFGELPLLRQLKDTAWRQLGSSGTGNHFVEFGLVDLPADSPDLGLKAGQYVGLLSHSGSRAFGATIAQDYTRLARQLCRLPRDAKHMAWLDMDSEAGQEYWLAMNLAGDYASACHDTIHARVRKALGREALAVVENHHNFAWKEPDAEGVERIVHRKGATPAHAGELGIIPGSMVAPGFIVRGKGSPRSLMSASHGAGRRLSRTAASNSITRSYLRKVLASEDITLIGGGPEEAPGAYKDIHAVMAAQEELVDVLGAFHPKIVRMAKQ